MDSREYAEGSPVNLLTSLAERAVEEAGKEAARLVKGVEEHFGFYRDEEGAFRSVVEDDFVKLKQAREYAERLLAEKDREIERLGRVVDADEEQGIVSAFLRTMDELSEERTKRQLAERRIEELEKRLVAVGADPSLLHCPHGSQNECCITCSGCALEMARSLLDRATARRKPLRWWVSWRAEVVVFLAALAPSAPDKERTP